MSERAAPLASVFERCAAEGRAALVLYTTAGHPSPGQALDVLLALADEGADVIELGVPFSDPLADGPTIQLSSFEALRQGVDLRFTLDLLRRFRSQRDTPVVLFSYLNPLLRYGVERFVADAEAAGAGGVLVTDLPVGADVGLEQALRASSMDLIRLAAPTSPPERVREIAERGSGFLYYIARTGVTGARATLADELEQQVRMLRGQTDLPLAVGFGISTPEQAARVARSADGVVVGSALVDTLATQGLDAARELVRGLRAAVER